jgi:DNA polymerase-3 subunit beta
VARLNREEFHSAVRRAALLTTEDSRAVSLDFAGGRLTITSRSPEQGEARIEMGVSYEGEPLEIGFNASYLLEILRYMPTGEVRLTLKAPERAATIEPVGGDDAYLCLVMPLRLLE